MGDRYISSGFLSKHLGTDKDYNENNTGIGYITPENILMGAYINSLKKPSAYVAKKFETDPYMMGPVAIRGGLLGGAVTGYNKSLLPLLMPEVSATLGDYQGALGLVPPVKDVAPAVLALQLRKKF